MVKHHENTPKSLECKEKPKESPEKKLKTLKKNEFQMKEPVVNGLDVWNMQLPFKQM